MLKELIHSLVRRKTPVQLVDFSRTIPVSSLFGLDRGTPIDRYYIDGFLARHQELIRGFVLEVSESVYSKRFCGKRVEKIDVLSITQNPSATVLGDLTNLDSLPAEAYDCFICTQTFNFIFDLQAAVRGAHHLLKPGGVLLASVAGISQISRYDMDRWGDFWRFTTRSVERLFAPLFGAELKVEAHGNALAACAFLQGVAVEDLPDRTLLDEPDADYQVLITILGRKYR